MQFRKIILFCYGTFVFALLLRTLMAMPARYWAVWHLHNPDDIFAAGPMGFSVEELSPIKSQFRGSISRSGNSPFELSKDKMKLAWVSTLITNSGKHDAAKASPAVDETGVYVGNDDGTFAAFDLNGSVKWVFRIANSSVGIHGTAALDESVAYIGGYNGSLYALEKADGRVKWIHELSQTALGASPALFEDSIYVSVETANPPDGYLTRLQRKDGKTVWRSSFMGEQGHSSPTINSEQRVLFAGANNGLMFAFDLDSGQIKWKFQALGAIKSTALYRKGFVYFGSRGGYFYKLHADSGKLVWQVDLGQRIHSSPAYVEDLGLIVVGSMNGKVNAIQAHDGSIQWQVENKIFEVQASPTVIKHKGKWAVWSVCGYKEICLLSAQKGHKLISLAVPSLLNGALVPWKESLFVALKRGGGLMKFE